MKEDTNINPFLSLESNRINCLHSSRVNPVMDETVEASIPKSYSSSLYAFNTAAARDQGPEGTRVRGGQGRDSHYIFE
jgi:hypothetical protein